MAKGRDLPEWFIAEPLIPPAEEFYLRAFYELNTCRPFYDGVGGSISWRDMVDYADRSPLDEELKPVFVVIMRALDQKYREWSNAERTKQRDIQEKNADRGSVHKGPK